jgi:hypothetical protein
MPAHVGLNVTTDARDELRQLKFALTGRAGRSVTLSDALIAAARLVLSDPALLDQAVTNLPEED